MKGLCHLALATIAPLALIGCAARSDLQNGSENGPEALLKKSMDTYKNLKSFSASCDWSDSFGKGSQSAGEKRTFEFQSPNKFRASTEMSGGRMSLYSISDGSKQIEYATSGGQPAQAYDSPADLASVNTLGMGHPMFCGTLLYKLFAGSEGYSGLVDTTKGAPTFGPAEKEPTETARHVKFYSTGLFGNADLLIGETSGLVYSISYDSDALLKMAASEKIGDPGMPKASETIEKYSDLKLNPTIAESEFAAVTPKGMKVATAPTDDSAPPVPPGSKAPEFKVTPVGGGAPVSLSSFKGKAVLVDFWATWCPPCRESLPHTQAIYNDLKNKGLQVLVVSDEEPDTISAFIKKNNYTFPVYRDENGAAEKTYKVDGIPSVLIIDKEGKLQNYFVGLQDEATLRGALKKIGVG